MRLVTHLVTLSLALQGASAFFPGSSNDVGAMLESRANGKRPPTYQQVLAASLKKYPGMRSVDNSGKLAYNLKPCDAKCEKKNEVKDKDGNCKACPKGKKPNKDQTKCVSNGGKEQGKCEDGKVLDPAAGGQDSKTDNPRCISDDDKKCPEGQRAESRRKGRDVDESTHKPNCAVDDDPDFRCDDSNTYDHRTIQDGKIKHSCRSTKKHEHDKKNKYDERVNSSRRDREQKTAVERRKKNRTGWCFVAIASFDGFQSFAKEVEALTEDEIEGMYAQFPEDAPDPSGDGSIPNHVVRPYKAPTLQIVMEGAGPGAIAGSIGTVLGGLGKIVGAAKGSTATSAAVRGIRSGSRRGPSSVAKNAGSKSSTVQKIFKDQRMLDCVFTGAALAGASKSKREDKLTLFQHPYYIEIDWRLTPEMSKPAPEGVAITVDYGRHEDTLDYQVSTSHETYYRANGISYEACNRGPLNDRIVSLQVSGGCCAFYDGDNCESHTHLFDMYNREHQDLQGDDRGTISSYWCTESEGCPGKP